MNVDSIWNDLVYAARRLWARPVLTIVSAVLLAFGIGLNAILFSVLDAFVLRPFPVRNPEELVEIQSGDGQSFSDKVSYPEYLLIRDKLADPDDVTVYKTQGGILKLNGVSEAVPVGVVSPAHFRFLGVRETLGTFASFETGTPAEPVAVLSASLWKRRFNASDAIIGSPVSFNGMQVRIVAVADPGYHGLDVIPADIWFAAETWGVVSNSESELQDAQLRNLHLWTRLPENANLGPLQSRLSAAALLFAGSHPEVQPVRVLKASRYSDLLRQRAGLSALLFGPVAVIILLVPCANVLGLLLIQAHARRREVAIRMAIGAGRRRILRQLVTESVLLALMGVGLGLLLATVAIHFVPSLLPALPIAVTFDFRIDHRTFAFASALALLTVTVCSLFPLRQATGDLRGSLSGESFDFGKRRSSPNQVVVVGQIAVSLALLSMAILLYRSYTQTLRLDPGFRPAPDVLILYAVPPINETPEARVEFYRRLQTRTEELPGVLTSAFASTIPLPMDGGGATREIWLPGKTDPVKPPVLHFNRVQPDYFNVAGVRFLLGGAPAQGRKQVVINETLSRRYWNDHSPVGDTIRIGGRNGIDFEIAGVVEDGKYGSIHESPQPYLFLPFDNASSGETRLLIRFDASVATLRQELRESVFSLSPDAALLSMLTLEEHFHRGLYVDRLVAGALGAFSAVGVGLAAVGLYGALAFSVRLRHRELAIRMAVGANPRQIVTFILIQGLRLGGLGIAFGVPMALLASRTVRGLLYGVRPGSPGALALVVMGIMGVLAAAALIPARKASKISSAELLRRCE
jgi:putative ABC transport system permease protein